MKFRTAAALLIVCAGCSSSPPPSPVGPPPSLSDFLPALPPTGGAALSEAGLVTLENRDAKLPKGHAAKGLVGDYYMQNDKIRLLIQAPVRVGEVLASGGNPINLDLMRAPGDSGGTEFGEIAPFLNLSHTAMFTRVEVLRDGKAGGPAVIRATGTASVLDYFNIAGFVAGTGILQWDSNNPPPVDIAATYLLSPRESNLHIIYTLFNRTDAALPLSIGSFTDTGGDLEVFTPGVGFGEGSYSDLARIFLSAKSFPYWATQSVDGAYGVLPVPKTLQQPAPNLGLFVAGIAGTLYDAPDSLLKAGSQTNFVIPPKQGRSFETYLLMGTDVADIHGQVLKLQGTATGTVQGRVLFDDGTAVAGARVAALDAKLAPVSVAVTQTDGSYRLLLEPESYNLIADQPGSVRRDAMPVTVTAGGTSSAVLSLSPPAVLTYTVTDEAARPLAAKIMLIGDDPSPPDNRFRDAEGLARGLVRVAYTWRGSSDLDGPITVTPGEYRVVITHGNEFSMHDELVSLEAGENPPVTAMLQRVVDTTGYVASDFHQHGVNSPDAYVPMRERVISYLAAGLEFVGSSDHDYLTDYGPVIRDLGMQDEIATMVGAETTPFDYGHFNAFPLPVNLDMPNRGAFDWSGGGQNGNLSPGRIFTGFRQLGAEVVQVNHPRVTNPHGSPVNGFQAYFDRAALTFDLDQGTFFGDKTAQPVANEILRIASDEPMWSDNFDTLEVYNGFSIADYDGDGEVDDQKLEINLRDWFNFLSMGKIVTALGNTDSHTRWSDTVDAPRNYVRVPDDSVPGAVRKEDILTALKVTHDVIVTNGPFITLHVNGDDTPAMGRVITDTSGHPSLTVKVQAPIWMQIDKVKIFCNNRYRIPPPGPSHDPMSPRLVIPLVASNPGPGEALLVRRMLAPGAERWEAQVEIPDFALPDPGRDAWIVAMVRGTNGMYPFVAKAIPGDAPIADLKAGTYTGGVFPLAFTNPAFIDQDGNGRYDAPLMPR
jgi:hypothetical protein